ncbi:glycosyltransferase [Streptomyces sp. IMTB 1903]|uniref:glycosyltransferase n=1 Tax=Streptomyces sp. IMTB 1903 TaxID=1776680 RepID=UPI0007571D72|nr:glycosyltransferase [Streptomyces sp. IMTB 1903]
MDPTPPAMNPSPHPRRILLATWGSTGDIAPYTGIATALRSAGHHLTVLTSSRYAPLFRAHHLDVHALPLDDHEDAIGRSPSRRARIGNAQDMAVIAAQGMLAEAEKPLDLVLAHPLLHPQAAVLARGLRVPCVGLYTVTHAMMLPRLLGPASACRYTLADVAARLALSPLYQPAVALLHRELGLATRLTTRLAAFHGTEPIRYGINPGLTPLPALRHPRHRAVGHWRPATEPGWTPDPLLEDFLAAGPPPVYFGFGSMSDFDADRLLLAITRTVRRLRIRAVVQSGWAQLNSRQEDLITVGACPHTWLFPRMRAAVHHAGPGTLHACLEAGTPAVPVPVTYDQPFWATRLKTLGLTPTALPVRQLDEHRLTTALEELLANPRYRQRTQHWARKLQAHDGTIALLDDIARLSRAHP